MKKIVKLIEKQEKGNISDAFLSWAEQMLLEKFHKYNLNLNQNAMKAGFEVVKETEKAYQIKVEAGDIYKSQSGDDYLGDDWNVWMPKSAFQA